MTPLSPWAISLVTLILCVTVALLVKGVKDLRAEINDVQQALSPTHLNLWMTEALSEWKKDREVPEEIMAVIDQVVEDEDTSTELRAFVLMSALTKEYVILQGKSSFQERFVLASVEAFDSILATATEEARSIRSSTYEPDTEATPGE